MADKSQLTITSSFLAKPTPKETPDILLTNFLRSGDVVATRTDETPQQKLKEILNDSRWTRRMLEDWFKKGPQSKIFSVTPDPEFRAIYLVLLSILEDHGKQTVRPGESGDFINTSTLTEEQQKEQQRRFDERVMEHFDKDSTWEKVEDKNLQN